MTSVQEILRDVGIGFEEACERASLRSECARMAASARARRARTLGMLPASDDVAVPAPAIALGRALAHGSLQPVGVVDALGNWPCARVLSTHAAPDGPPMITSWVLEGLALLTPRDAGPATGLSALRTAVADPADGFDHLIFDLTGLDHLGEHLAAFDLLDAVVLVARSGRTTTRQVSRRLSEIPERRALGVLLTGL